MIYIVGYTFQYNARPRIQSTGLSVQERIALSKSNQPIQKNISTDSQFINGHTYKLVRIFRTLEENNDVKWHYIFSNLSNTSSPDIDITVSSSTAGDDYIASISGKTKQLEEERKQIALSREQNTDI